MAPSAASTNRHPWKFWLGLIGVGVVYILASITIHLLPENRSARDQRERLCDQAAAWVLTADDLVTLERGKFVVKELDCDLA